MNKESKYELIMFTNVFSLHTQKFLVLNISNGKANVHVDEYWKYSSTCTFAVTFIHKLLLLVCELHYVCVWIFETLLVSKFTNAYFLTGIVSIDIGNVE